MTVKEVFIFNIVMVSIILVVLIILGFLLAKYEMKRREQVARLTANVEQIRKELVIAQANNKCLEKTIEKLKEERVAEVKEWASRQPKGK